MKAEKTPNKMISKNLKKGIAFSSTVCYNMFNINKSAMRLLKIPCIFDSFFYFLFVTIGGRKP